MEMNELDMDKCSLLGGYFIVLYQSRVCSIAK